MIELQCHICGRPHDVARRDMLRLPLATYRACPECRDTPIAPCEVVWSERSQYWAVTVPDCPHCHKKHFHFHGGGSGPAPDLGHRAAHCLTGSGSYELVETDASRIERARQRTGKAA